MNTLIKKITPEEYSADVDWNKIIAIFQFTMWDKMFSRINKDLIDKVRSTYKDNNDNEIVFVNKDAKLSPECVSYIRYYDQNNDLVSPHRNWLMECGGRTCTCRMRLASVFCHPSTSLHYAGKVLHWEI